MEKMLAAVPVPCRTALTSNQLEKEVDRNHNEPSGSAQKGKRVTSVAKCPWGRVDRGTKIGQRERLKQGDRAREDL